MALTLHGTVSDNTVVLDRKTATPLIINGDMQIAQRATSVTGQTGSGYIVCDRWLTDMSTAGTWTVSQSTDAPTSLGFRNSTKYDCTTANGSLSAGSFMTHQMRFEGQDLQLFKKGTSSAENFTVSFWVKSAKTGTYIVELWDNDNTRQVSQAYTISSADTWEKKVLSFPADTTGAFDNDNASSLHMFFWLLSGTNYASGTLSTTWTSNTNANRAVGQVNLADSTDNDWYITGVQLEVGEFDANSIPSFQFEDRATSLARCQRYYYKAITGTLFNQLAFCNVRTTTSHYALMQMPVTLRANPTSVDFGSIGIIASWGAAVVGLSSLTFANAAYGPGTTQVLLDAVTGSAVGTVGNVSILLGANSATGFIGIDSEL